MKTIIHGKSRSKVTFIDETKAKVELENGGTWIVGFPTPLNYEMMIFIVMEPKRSEERKRIGERIKELRKKRKLDAKTLASRIGIDASNLSRIEQGHYSVGFDILTKIATALNAKVDIVENDNL